MKQYHDLMRHVLDNGTNKEDRTGRDGLRRGPAENRTGVYGLRRGPADRRTGLHGRRRGPALRLRLRRDQAHGVSRAFRGEARRHPGDHLAVRGGEGGGGARAGMEGLGAGERTGREGEKEETRGMIPLVSSF